MVRIWTKKGCYSANRKNSGKLFTFLFLFAVIAGILLVTFLFSLFHPAELAKNIFGVCILIILILLCINFSKSQKYREEALIFENGILYKAVFTDEDVKNYIFDSYRFSGIFSLAVQMHINERGENGVGFYQIEEIYSIKKVLHFFLISCKVDVNGKKKDNTFCISPKYENYNDLIEQLKVYKY